MTKETELREMRERKFRSPKTIMPDIERIKEFSDYIEEEGVHDLATELSLRPFSQDEIVAYATAYFRSIGMDDDTVVEPEGSFYCFVQGPIYMARSTMQDAAVMWVANRFGKEVADELELVLEDDDQVMKLSEGFDRMMDVWVKEYLAQEHSQG